VFSAHWQAAQDKIKVNTAESAELIYDFYGFPSHYYKEKYPNVGSKEIAQKVINAIQDAGMKAEGVTRGLDHGVWTSFKCGTHKCIFRIECGHLVAKTLEQPAFDQEENPLNVPNRSGLALQ